VKSWHDKKIENKVFKTDEKVSLYHSFCKWFPGDVGMPFGYPHISIPGPTHYRGGPAQGLDRLEYKMETLYSTRTLVNPSLIAYIKPGRAPLETHHRQAIL
jgi:hypothetical protein